MRYQVLTCLSRARLAERVKAATPMAMHMRPMDCHVIPPRPPTHRQCSHEL